MKVRIAEIKDKERWDDFVLSHDAAGPYHLFMWREAIENAYNHKAYYLMAEKDGQSIKAALPFVLIKPPFLKGLLVSQPFCDYGGMLTENSDASELIIKQVMKFAGDLDVKFEVRCKNQNSVLNSCDTVAVASYKSRMLLDLPESSEILWKGLKSKLRSQIRRPQKEGLVFALGKTERLDDFYSVFSRNMQALGSPVHSRKWIESVLDSYDEDAHIGIVYADKQPVGAGFILSFRDTVSIPWASTLREYNKYSPNMMLYWGFLDYACDNGFKYFDFGRSTPGEGTYNFKRQWGAQPIPLHWYRLGGSDQKEIDPSNGEFRQKIETIWSNLPPLLANALGPILRKYISL